MRPRAPYEVTTYEVLQIMPAPAGMLGYYYGGDDGEVWTEPVVCLAVVRPTIELRSPEHARPISRRREPRCVLPIFNHVDIGLDVAELSENYLGAALPSQEEVIAELHRFARDRARKESP